MKKITILFSLLLSCMILSQKESNACINPDSVVVIIVNYGDSINPPFIDEVSIRMSNLRFMNEDPNKICSCALTKYSQLFTNIEYMAFVDSGTNNPYQGFAAFNNLLASNTAWNNASTPHNNWDGYVANVINSGLKATDPVELVIRASAPMGVLYTLVGDTALMAASLMDAVESEAMGTDEWNGTTMSLVQAHQGVRSFNPIDGSTVNYQKQDHNYFTKLDSDILNNIPDGILERNTANTLKVYPNPFEDELFIEWTDHSTDQVELSIRNLMGQIVYQKSVNLRSIEQNRIGLDLSSVNLDNGYYVIEMDNGRNIYSARLIH